MTPPPKGHDDHPALQLPLGHVDEWESSAIDYLAARLSPTESSAIAEHLSACRSCRERLAEQTHVILALGAVEMVEVPRGLESRVFDRLFPTPATPSPTESTRLGALRRLFAGAAKRRWVPAAIAAIVVMVALAGSTDIIRFGSGTGTPSPGIPLGTTAGSDLRSSTMAAGVQGADGQTQELKTSPPSSAAASLPGRGPSGMESLGPETRDAVGNAVGAPGAAHAVSTVWANVEVATGDVNAGSVIEEVTGLRPVTMQADPGEPIYAAMVQRGSIGAVVRQLSDAGLAVTLTDVPEVPLDTGSIQGLQGISALPHVEPVSPQGDTLSLSISSAAANTQAEYVLMVLTAVR